MEVKRVGPLARFLVAVSFLELHRMTNDGDLLPKSWSIGYESLYGPAEPGRRL